MRIHYLSQNNSILNHFVSQIRDVNIHKDSMRFRRNIERIGEIMAYEMSKSFEYEALWVQTPLGQKETAVMSDQVVLCSILRAGLPLHTGFLNYYDQAENGFISAHRYHPNNDEKFEIKVEYQAIADVTDKIVLLVDPMLATGQSMIAVLKRLLERGKPKEIHLAVVIAAPEGIAYLEEHLPENCHLWIASSADEKLNLKSYIVPGLGDAGDLAYGVKL